ncbi:hypothetical protein B0F90DRAFT_838623 [Multifurca ochricompacta]|uniref:Uncharacterized protein n=1 Tax=Multifurca ochricompacta TaxID=376703 RepID=A0AAD4QM85_9AGAM|nr:hypothetical protein B0F90DRAFT_838623 [Multifurca ochricompacta]
MIFQNLPEDQCIFVRGFRVTRIIWMLPRKLRGEAEPAQDPDGYDCDPDTKLMSIPSLTEYRDPLHLLLEYIGKRSPDCDMVLVHDDDLEGIDGISDDSSLESDAMLDHFQRSNAEIHKVLCDLSPGDAPTNNDTKAVRVAMLSKFFQRHGELCNLQ